jgi:tetratricopeptide (TPR) repeat protein
LYAAFPEDLLMNRFKTLGVCAALAVLLSAAGAARAAGDLTPQQKAEMKVLYEKATRAYDVGKYAEAIEEYQKAYEIGGDPPMLYNIAQAYRLNDQPAEAVRFYRRYLQRAPQARNREDVERKIADLERKVEERRKAAAAAPPPPVTTAPPATPPPVTPPPSAPVVPSPGPGTSGPSPSTGTSTVGEVTQTPPPEESMSPERKIVGWSIIGAGVAAGVGSVITGLLSKSKSDKVGNDSQSGAVFNPDDEVDGKNYERLAIGLGIGAGAAVVTGAIVLLTGGSSSAESTPAEAPVSTARVVPWLSGGIVGAGADIRF